ncbi:hypothetical protein J7M07_00740, partial [bacterium]|nr:hypothetical protein [bacterium]
MFLSEKRIIYSVVFAVVTIFLGCKGNDLDKASNVSFGVNLIENPSFEKWVDSIPDGWEERVIDEVSSEGAAVNRFKKSSEDKKSGNYSCCFEGHDTTNKWIALVQVVPVIGGSDLIISSDIKTKSLRGISARNTYSNLFVSFLDKDAKRLIPAKNFVDVMMHRNVGTKPWHNSKKKITVPAGARFAEIGLLSTMSGVICFDNVEAVLREKTPWIKKDTKYITFYYLPKHPFPEGAIEMEAGAIENYAERINLGKIS